MSDWIREYFEHGYAQRWGLAPPSDHVRLEAAGLWDLLHLSPNSKVVDIGCGHGRHALALAPRGLEITGVDSAVALLIRAQHLSAELGVSARWVRGDMRQLPLRSGCFDGAILLDAFGFFETEQENETVLQEAVRVLVQGGRLGLKVLNGGPVLGAFRETDREEREGTLVTISRKLSSAPPRITERISVSGSRGSGQYERRQRLYRVEEVSAALVRAGLSVMGVFASPNGAAFEPTTSATMWVVSQARGPV